MANLPIEKDEKMLQKYGLASALLSSAEYVLGELIRLFGGLTAGNIDLVNELLDNKTFGSRVSLAKNVIKNEELLKKLTKAVENRNLLAHGVTAMQGDIHVIMHKKKTKELTCDGLDEIIKDTREVIDDLIKEIQTKFKLKQTP